MNLSRIVLSKINELWKKEHKIAQSLDDEMLLTSAYKDGYIKGLCKMQNLVSELLLKQD